MTTPETERLGNLGGESTGAALPVPTPSALMSEATDPYNERYSNSDIFAYEVEIDVADPLLISGGCAHLHGRFRHRRHTFVEFGPASEQDLNLGIRIYRMSDDILVFEDRMLVSPVVVDPDVWAAMSVRIPADLVTFGDTYRLVIDFVKENEYWFATVAGFMAFEAKVRFADPNPSPRGARSAIDQSDIASPVRRMPERPLITASTVPHIAVETQSACTFSVVFDVSDLINYFENARLPTGIQRVQIEIITHLIFSRPADLSLQIGCFTKRSDSWLELPLLFFNHICKLALIGGETDAAEWRRVLEELSMHLAQAKQLVFPVGAYLINLGTSWWLQNYFLRVRAAKARYGIRYVPFVHDCIPIVTPEHCVEGLTRDFITWVMGAFQHADHLMVNSQSTANDVCRVASFLGHETPSPAVVRLDADYRAANVGLASTLVRLEENELFLKNDLRSGQYVLFVSTIESRKNHLMAFSAWLSLIKKFGAHMVPKLVCVGNRGWLNDAIYAKLGASKLLRQKVVMLSKISDPDLELLYRNCLFTLYPSSYEGWGLPVTESLCFGKVPVLARSSSLPEAGGEFAEYFDLGSESELLSILERMIFDRAYRDIREKRVVDYFQPRSWTAIANEVVALVKGWASADGPVVRTENDERGLWPFPIELGRYYGLVENEETQIWRGMIAAEMFRQGDGWWWPEPWGCWTKAKVARLAFIAPMATESSAIVYVGIRGVQGVQCKASVTIESVATRQLPLLPDQSRWIVFRLEPKQLEKLRFSASEVLLEILFSADRSTDFSVTTDGVDHRVASIGVLGFMMCKGTDFSNRLDFIESVSLGDLKSLSGRPVDAADYFSATAVAPTE